MQIFHSYNKPSGFTLIEMSIALVIIGLIVGGILTGRDLIDAAKVRAQISQIEKYNTAVHTFQGKYGGLPGDLALNLAKQFGLNTTGCDGSSGERDGNGLLEGFNKPSGTNQEESENYLFWQDLSMAGLIDGSFPGGGATSTGCNTLGVDLSLASGSSSIGDFIPTAKIGQGNFIYTVNGIPESTNRGDNWFGLAAVTSIAGNGGNDGDIISVAGLSVQQASDIDRKIDDGTPGNGSVMAVNLTDWWFGYLNMGTNNNNTTCGNTTANAYSTKINGGSNINCALVFRFE